MPEPMTPTEVGPPARVAREAWRQLNAIEATPHAIALGIATGVFVAFLPLIGVQMVLATLIAWAGRASIGAALLGTWAGNPVTWPLMWMASYGIGLGLLGQAHATPLHEIQDSIARVGRAAVEPARWQSGLIDAAAVLWPILKPLLLGSLVLGLAAGAVLYCLARWAASACQFRDRPVS